MLNIPFESREGSSSLGSTAHSSEADAITEEDGEGNETGEPEQHGNGFGSKNAELVRGTGEAGGCYDEIDQCEYGPYATKDEEVDFGGRYLVPMA